jgi:hypothetical protein
MRSSILIVQKPISPLLIALVILIFSTSANAYTACIDTGVPFLINGRDSGYNVEILLASYDDTYPQFGEDKEAHWELLADDTIRVYFHPTNCYEKGCQYYLYAGIHRPRSYKDGKSCAGYDKWLHVKDKEVNFEGSFRFVSGNHKNRRSFYITPGFGYANKELNDKKVCVFNDHGGEVKPLEQAHMAHSERNWWHNIYWGTWYAPKIVYPGNDSTPSEWIRFKNNLNEPGAKCEALAQKRWFWADKPHFKQDYIVLEQATVGAEYFVGDGPLVFDVKNLNLLID